MPFLYAPLRQVSLNGIAFTSASPANDPVVAGTAGNDTMSGSGNSGNAAMVTTSTGTTFYRDYGAVVFIGSPGFDSITTGSQSDFLDYSLLAGPVSISFDAGLVGTIDKGGLGKDTLHPFNSLGISKQLLNIVGTALNDTLTSPNASGPYSLTGGAGDDLVVGNVMTTADYSTSPHGIVADLAAGTAQDGFGGTDTLVGLSSIEGSKHNDSISGTAAGDTWFNGSDGNDTYAGHGSNNVLTYWNMVFDNWGAGYGATIAPLQITLTGPDAGTVVKPNGIGTDSFSGVHWIRQPGGPIVFQGTAATSGDPFTFDVTAGDTVDGANSPLNEILLQGLTATVDLKTGVATLFNGTASLSNVAYIRGTGYSDTISGSDRAEVFDVSTGGYTNIDAGLGRDMVVAGYNDILSRNADGSFSLTDTVFGYTTATLRGIEVARLRAGDISMLPHAADFSATGTDALLWRNEDGSFWQWSLSGTAITGGGGQSVGTDWTLLGSGDLYGDGHGSLLWRHAGDGVVWAWHMNGASIAGGGAVAAVDSSWSVVAMADFTGGGRTDILWRHTGDGALWLFAMNGTAIGTGSGAVLNPGVPWVPVGAADLNGDGRADLLWRNPGTGEFYAWTMDGTAVTGMASLGTPWLNGETDWALAGTGDFNGDGQADLLLRSAGSGDLLLWQTKPGGGHVDLAPSNPGLAWQVAALADVNGDGFSDIVWRNATTGQPYVWLMQGATILAQGSLPDPGSNWHIVG
jgi:hypothetical protein